MTGSGAAAATVLHGVPRLSRGIRRLGLVYIWIAIASIAIVSSEPAPYDALIVGALFLLPLTGLAPLTRGIGFYFLLWMAIAAAASSPRPSPTK